VLAEFEAAEEASPSDLSLFTRRSCPKMSQCMSILVKKLSWMEEYALEKMTPLLTRWQLEHLASGGVKQVVKLEQILKRRVVAGVHSLLLQWYVLSKDAEETKGMPDTFESVEPTDLVHNAYPELYDKYVAETEKKKRAPPRKAPSTTAAQARKKKDVQTAASSRPITNFFTQRKKSDMMAAAAEKAVKVPLNREEEKYDERQAKYARR
jgi:hypothetical protein